MQQAFLRQKAIMDEKAIRKKGYKDGIEYGEKKGIEEEKEIKELITK